MDFIALIGIGISAFIATNIDDIFVLMFFFSNSTFEKGQVIAGQYLGIGLLVAISTLGVENAIYPVHPVHSIYG